MTLTHSTDFQAVPETEDAFLALFPWRYDYIHSRQGFIADWRTVTNHPLSDRLIHQGFFLYGVRFGYTTAYAMLDIDADSPYHPNRDPLAIERIMQALEKHLGIVSQLTVTSSYSGGLHVYLPLGAPFRSWDIAHAIALVLESVGFIIAAGKLEIFPNRKTTTEQRYAAHRLPLQAGSYLQDAYNSKDEFVNRWHLAAEKNAIDQGAIDRVFRTLKRQPYRLTKSATKFLQDLDAEIEPGWTGPGQTNRLLGRIALRGYCFGHVIGESDQPITGDRLVKYVISTARSLPGFREHCGHQADLADRASHWARSAESSPKYFPYALGKDSLIDQGSLNDQPKELTAWNMLQMQLARLKIREAIADLLDRDSLPSGTRERMFALTNYGISPKTLYKHEDLWHPEKLLDPAPLDSEPSSLCEGNQGISLLALTGCNNSLEARLRHFLALEIYQKQGRSSLPIRVSEKSRVSLSSLEYES
jgi:hypothetical protein